MAQTDVVTIAYFTVVNDKRHGWTGGLLLLNSAGRPLEFQCTLPVRPSRAHEILFGSTLREHLIGEVIGPLLVKKCRAPILLLCCDQPEAMRLGATVDFPVALMDEAAVEEKPVLGRTDPLVGFVSVEMAGSELRVAMESAEQVRELVGKLNELPDAVEPFERIREAIKEAHSQIARAPVVEENPESQREVA